MALSESIFDAGAQLERTALSWQRTMLSLAVASLASGRGLEPLLGPASWLLAALGVGISIAVFVITRRRYLQAHYHLTTVDAQSLPGSATLVVATAAVALVAGVAALVFVLTG